MEQKKKLLVICGPTGTGKTALGIKLAKKFNGEIISADSRQVYQYMDVGTGKDLPTIAFKRCHLVQGGTLTKEYRIGFYEIDEIKVWLLDIVRPDYRFSVTDYVKCANLVIKDIDKRGKLPIIVGGTGLYIKGLIDGIETMGVPPDWELRTELSSYSVVQLLALLEKLDLKKLTSMNNSDRNNPRRLIRAIEIAVVKGKKIPALCYCHSTILQKNMLFIGLRAPFKFLYQRIDQRVEKRIKTGMEDEIKNLQVLSYTFENSAMGTTIGYKEWKEYFCHPEFISGSDSGQAGMTKKILKQVQNDVRDKIVQKWKFDEHAYARRQITWFRKDKRVKWFNIMESDVQRKIEKVIDKWYNT